MLIDIDEEGAPVDSGVSAGRSGEYYWGYINLNKNQIILERLNKKPNQLNRIKKIR